MFRFVLTAGLVVLVSSPTSLWAQQQPRVQQQGPTLESRVQRLERLIENQVLREMLDRLEQLQNETRELRGELEGHNHRIEGLKRRQRELYIDIDRRLHTLERSGVAQSPQIPVPSQPPAPTLNPRVSQTPPVAQAPVQTGTSTQPTQAPKPKPVNNAAEQGDYEKAFNLLREGRYEQAESAFKGFLGKYPQGRYAANAQYWLGEVFYLGRDFDKALVEFNKVIVDHPDSPKRANALLKIGFVHFEKGAWKEARKALESVVRDYKGHSAARLAANRLNQLTQEGH